MNYCTYIATQLQETVREKDRKFEEIMWRGGDEGEPDKIGEVNGGKAREGGA
jgi:hypothetical protein